MKKWMLLILLLVISLCLLGCGKSEAVKNVEGAIAELTDITVDSKDDIELAEAAYEALSEDDKADVENYMDLLAARKEFDKVMEEYREEQLIALFAGVWKNAADGDTYTLETDGTGKHDDVTITYSWDLENETISIVEGVSSVQGKVFALDNAVAFPRLVPEGENTYYVREENYEEVSKLVQEETWQVMQTYEWWKSTKALNYISFFENGGGWFLLSGYTTGLKWEFVDNNTIKMTVETDSTFTITLDVVNENGEMKMLNSSDGSVTYIPKQ